MGRRSYLIIGIVLATVGAFVMVGLQTGHGAMHAMAHPHWPLLIAAFAVSAGVQPLRALAWRMTLREPIEFKAIYASSAIGSFLDTVLPGRLGEASKAAVLRVASGPRWPGFARAAGSLLCAHLLEAIAFALVGAVSAFFLPFPNWARGAMMGGLGLAAGVIFAAVLLHKKIGHKLPKAVDRFLAGAAAPPSVLIRAGGTLLLTWLVRWGAIFLLLHSVGVKASVSAALLYMIVTGLANTAPILPGNTGVYQGAAIGALALVGFAGSNAVAVSIVAPVLASVATAAAAVVGIALYGRRCMMLPRAAWAGRAAS
jgi:uncharacterized membrane protein YbhN (UPF0104 family)